MRNCPTCVTNGRPRQTRVLITGAKRNVRRGHRRGAFVARGAEVVSLDLHPQPADTIEVIACDITDRDSVVAGVDKAIELLGGLDILINNAGTGGPAPAEFALTPSCTRSSRST